VAQQLTHAGVGRLASGLLVKALRLQFHQSGLLAHRVQAQRPHQPNGFATDEALDILTADQRNVLAEAFAIQVQQAMAMAVFLSAHLAKFLRLGWITRLQPLGEIVVDAGVLLFERDGQGQNLLLTEALESAHDGCSSRISFHLTESRRLPSLPPSFIIIRVKLSRSLARGHPMRPRTCLLPPLPALSLSISVLSP